MNKKITYTPSQLITFVNSRFAAWYDRAEREFPEICSELKNPEDEMLAVLRDKGLAHENEVFQNLEKEFKSIKRDTATFEETVQHLKNGTELLFQARLETDNFRGIADFIVKEGDEYIVMDTKLKKSVVPYMIFQLCIYSEAIGNALGKLPSCFKVITGDGVHHKLKLADYYAYFKSVESDFLEFQKNFDINNPPKPEDFSDHGDWSDYAQKLLDEKKHLSLIANISRKQISKLNATGIHSTEDLLRINPEKIKGMKPEVLAKLKKQNKLQIESLGSEKPKFEIVCPFTLPAPSPMDVFFDMEGYPLYDDGLEYLFGMCVKDEDTVNFVDFWAHNHAEEKKAFEEFIDYCVDRYMHDPSMHIYHYANYEVAAMRKLSTKYGTREDEVDEFLKLGVFVDLYKVIKKSFMIGTPSYSIKSVELLYRGKRESTVTNAGDSVVAYSRWAESGESIDWRESPLLKSIRDYNEDDCVSTLELVEWLRPYSSDEALTKADPAGSAENVDNDKDSTGDEEVSFTIPPHLSEKESLALQNLFHMTNFHRRSKKPFWWRYFDSVNMTQEEIEEDLECLSDLNFISSDKNKFTYSYNSTEETKLGKDSKCATILEKIKVSIHEIDPAKEEIILTVPKNKISVIPKNISLMSHDFINDESLRKCVNGYFLKICTSIQNKETIKCPIWDFLTKAKPRLNGLTGQLINESHDFLEECKNVVTNMDNTTLCIQGPPGAGKTYTASHVIAHLISNGKKVAITSNSHKAINHLLLESILVIEKNNKKVKGYKVTSDRNNQLNHPQIEEGEFGDLDLSKFQIVAGTAWAMARFSSSAFDYVFVDEASQVASANIMSIASGAKNIVIMGDQMQLGQPTQGQHPLESGKSILEYYIGDMRTIPKDMGIFLPNTFRMHPSICNLISVQVYESRLKPADHCKNRILFSRKDKSDPEAGIYFLPVEHADNTQCSTEEVEAILRLKDELIGRMKTNKDGQAEGPLTLEDILFVAPYNHQVKLLQEALGPDAHVGSVDKFQGQERPVVILSMCTSSAEVVGSRGVEFLFSINRLNVALSRAQSLVYVVGSPALKQMRTNSIKKMPLLNFWCALMSYAKTVRI